MANATPTANTMIATIGATVAKNLLMIVGAAAASHGLISGTGVETFVSLGMVAVGAIWSFWNSYGRSIVLAKLEIWKATAEAQAEALRKAKVPAPTHAEIADKIPDPTVTATTVAKVVTAGCLALIVCLAFAAPTLAQPKQQEGIKLPIPLPLHPRTDATDGAFSGGGGFGAAKGLPGLLGALDAKLLPDLQYALKLAEASNSRVTAPCYKAWIDIINTRQKAVEDGGQAVPLPDPHLVTDFEKLVELRNSLQPDSPFMIACSPVASMVRKDILGFIGTVITGGAGLATLVPGL